MTKGVGSPLSTVMRKIFDTIRATSQANKVNRNIYLALCSVKKVPISRARTGTLAPQFIKGTVKSVAIRSLGERSVLVAITPGTAQPPAIPPETINGITEEPCSPKIRNTLSII